jgi:two-component system, chemotaxis family, response regulator Rcp1
VSDPALMVHAIDILLVEDSPADVRLTQEALQGRKMINRLTVAGDGVEALAILRRQGQHANAARPDLILLDLNLPRKNGRAVLAEIKEDPNLKSIPVVVVTSSRAEQDIVKSYNLHANCYITKPIDLENFMRMVHAIEDFWVGIVKLPPK